MLNLAGPNSSAESLPVMGVQGCLIPLEESYTQDDLSNFNPTIALQKMTVQVLVILKIQHL